ncbi:MAG: MBL fold metallo-hydrolase [Actinobacteria bacterium]|nr:MBL fold metallo-hydrolase [Actinomycetota bacterium]
MAGAPVIRVLEPAAGVLAFYAGRDGSRFAAEANWVDEGAIGLGIASYALLVGAEAIVYDTGISVEWGRFVRAELERRGARRLTVVLSHWHLDHVAGTEAFGDCEVLANERTAAHLARHREAIEAGSLEGPPPIAPLLLPTRTFAEREALRTGSGEGAVEVELLTLDIHSDDATVLWIPGRGLLLCGDTLEDTVTYVDEPRRLGAHLRDLERLRRLGPRAILPNHGDPATIAAGGYPPGLIDATEAYLRLLLAAGSDPAAAARPLRDVLPALPGAGALRYFEPYEEVHRHNLEAVAGRS